MAELALTATAQNLLCRNDRKHAMAGGQEEGVDDGLGTATLPHHRLQHLTLDTVS